MFPTKSTPLRESIGSTHSNQSSTRKYRSLKNMYSQSQELTKMADEMSSLSKNPKNSERVRSKVNGFGAGNKENVDESNFKSV